MENTTHPKLEPSGPPMGIFGFLREVCRDPLAFYLTCTERYGDVVQIRYGLAGDLFRRQWSSRGLILNHPTDIKHVLVTNQRNYQKFLFPPAGQRVFGKGLLTSEDPLHLRQRRMMQPFFHHQRIAHYADVMVTQTAALLNTWPDGATVDVAQEMMQLTLTIVCQALFHADPFDETTAIGESITVGMHHLERRFTSFFGYFPLAEMLPTSANRRFQKAVGRLDRVISAMIQKRRADSEHANDLLDALLSARDESEAMDDQQVRDELITLFLAGHETTATALAWTWYLLAQHPEVEARLVTELRDVLNGRLPAAADVPKLSYTAMAFAESMRLYPPVWGLSPRTAVHADRLPSGTAIASGDVLYIIPYAVHRNPRIFLNPERFDPKRFSQAAVDERLEYAYFPFGGGSRSCIGESFARMEAVLLIATIAQHFKMELVPGQTIVPEPLVTLRPKHGIWMRLRKR